jgi:hypothetical protein
VIRANQAINIRLYIASATVGLTDNAATVA